ncbi:porin family protein [Adhaeribacter swui]|nr:porin family protein [Adhaeribacter swui]
MKKCCLLVGFLLGNIAWSYGQTSFGIKGGVNLTNVDFQKSRGADYQTKVRFNVGALWQKEFNAKLFGRAELLYSLKGTTIALDNAFFRGKGIDEYHYLNLPLLAGYHLTPKFSFVLGPELGYLVYGRENFGDNPKNITAACNKFDLAVAAGISYKIKPSLDLEARYSYGFNNILSYTDYDANGQVVAQVNDGQNRVLQVGVVYYFSKK